MKTKYAKYNNRLLRLAKFLRALPPDRFNYNVWFGSDWEGFPDLSCGTTACAFGWAMAMPEFRKLGFHAALDEYYTIYTTPSCQQCGSSDAGKELFGIEDLDFDLLFFPGVKNGHLVSPDGDASAKQVANHIVRFVRRRRAEHP